MNSGSKRYIITREPIGTANKHYQDLSQQISSLEATLTIIHTIVQSLEQKSNSIELKFNTLVESTSKTNQVTDDISAKVQGLSVQLKRKRRLKVARKKKSDSEEKSNQTSSDDIIKKEDPQSISQNPTQVQVERSSLQSPNISTEVEARQAVIVNNTVNKPTSTEGDEERENKLTGTSVLLTLNKEDDFPEGCWLGDSKDPNRRVRVAMKPKMLDFLTKTFDTPEKLALALLDKLFSRETLASSNLTGKGKHQKRKLDPLIIYGIYSQLRHLHNISDADWTRIKNNMEAKCRFLWRRKMKAKEKEQQLEALGAQSQVGNGESEEQKECETLPQPPPALVGWTNEVMIAGRSTEDTGNIVLYPLYQVDSSQLIQVAGLEDDSGVDNSDKAKLVSEASLTETVQDTNAMEVSETVGEQVVHLNHNKAIDQDGPPGGMSQQTLTLAAGGGDLIMTDLGEVISITSETADVDCMMVSSVDYL